MAFLNTLRPGRLRLGFGMAFAAIAFAASSNAFAQAREVRVGVYSNEPKLAVGSDGQPTGILGDLLKEIAREEGWQLTPVVCAWKDCLELLASGELDLMPDVAYSAERALRFDFHKLPALHSWSEIYLRAGVKVRSMLDLQGKRIAVLENSIQYSYLESVLSGFGVKADLVAVKSIKEAFERTAAGEFDAAAANRFFGDLNAARFGLNGSSLLFQPAQLFYASGKGRNAELLVAIDRHLADWQTQQDSPQTRIEHHWMGGSSISQGVPVEVWWGIGGLGLALALALGFAVSLRRMVEEKTRKLLAGQDALIRSEARYHSIFSNSHAAMLIIDPTDGRIIDANPAAIAFYGWSSQELLAMSITQINTFSRQQIREEMARARQAQRNCFQFQHRIADGSCRDVEVFSGPIQMDDREVLFSIVHDVTDRRLAHEAEARAARALRLVSDCNIALFSAEDEKGLLRETCRLICDVAGYRMAWVGFVEADEDCSVQPVAEWGFADGYLQNTLISWNDATPNGRGPTGSAVRTGMTQVNSNYLTNPDMAPWRDAALQRGYQSGIALPLISDQRVFGALTIYSAAPEAFSADEVHLLEEMAGNLSFGITTLRDRQRRQLAESATLAKSNFLANMSHEIRTPMNAIIGLTYLMRKNEHDPLRLEKLDKISQAANHLLSIINDILDFSKIEAGKLQLEARKLDIRTLANNIASMLAQQVAAKGLQFRIEMAHLPRNLYGDMTRLTQAFLNLASNAVKFTAQGKVSLRITKIAETTGDVKLRFEVQDTGVGVDAAVLPKLFTPFQQADNSTTRNFGGTGLGLAITRRLAELMGGEAGATSVPGQGSNFWFTARLKKANEPDGEAGLGSRQDSADQVLARDHAGTRVLLVEDDPINQEVARDLLEELGLLVDVAQDGVEAVEKIRQGSPVYGLVLMDMQMPRMDGPEATQQIRSLPASLHLPIIAMTANAYSEDRERCLSAGMNDFVTKPVDPDLLYSTLLKWLNAKV